MDLQALRELEAKATPAPWVTASEYIRRDYGIEEMTTIGLKDGDYAVKTDYPIEEADAALIAALRNSAPSLIDAAAILRELVDVMLLELSVGMEFVGTMQEEAAIRDDIRRRKPVAESRAKAWREAQP